VTKSIVVANSDANIRFERLANGNLLIVANDETTEISMVASFQSEERQKLCQWFSEVKDD
jgi:hypothetical protein